MKRRTWTPPAVEPPQGQAPVAPSASPTSQQSAGGYAKKLIRYAAFFGVIGILFRSWFPLALGAFMFFTDDQFIEWALGQVGIRIVPDTLGSQFIRTFVFLVGLGLLFAKWKDSMPAWLTPWLPFDASWPQLGAIAVAIALLALISARVTKSLLLRLGIERAPGTLTFAIDSLIVLALLTPVFAAPAILRWFEIQ
jgi:hypothetical protein